jgi:hypothetical protein
MGFLPAFLRPRYQRSGNSLKSRPRFGLGVERLEDRLVLSTFYVEGPGFPIDATHVQTLQDALGAAANGDAVIIQPGVTVKSFGSTLGQANGVATLIATAKPTDTSITVGNYVSPGEEIVIGAGAGQETDLVLNTTAQAGGAEFTVNLKVPLALPHAVGTRVDTSGRLGVGKTLFITGTPGANGAVGSPLDVWGVTLGVNLQYLSFASTTSLQLLNGAQGTTISNCSVWQLTEVGGGSNNGNNVIQESTLLGTTSLTGNNSGTTTADQLLYDQVRGPVQILHDDGALLKGNTFTLTASASPGLSITDSQNLTAANNVINMLNPIASSSGGLSTAIAVASTAGTTNPVSVTLQNNTVNTSLLGLGILLSPSAGNGSNFRALLQGNDFHYNMIGLEDIGDGTATATAAGLVDLGGGALGSLGGNDFRGFLASDATAGNRYAIFLRGTTGANSSITALDNLWSVAGPTDVVRDSQNNTSVGSLPAGTGVIDVGTAAVQLTAEQQFVQTLFNNILGRSGQLDELNQWVAQIATIGTTGVSNDLIHSEESYTRIVDGFYIRFLGRQADPSGETAWVNEFLAGATMEQVAAGFVGSAEYYDRVGATGDPDANFVRSLYSTLLGRTGANSEVDAWLQALPVLGRTGVAMAFFQSTEYRSIFVGQAYYNLLRRFTPPSQAEVNSWVLSGEDLFGLLAGMTGSQEYFTNS